MVVGAARAVGTVVDGIAAPVGFLGLKSVQVAERMILEETLAGVLHMFDIPSDWSVVVPTENIHSQHNLDFALAVAVDMVQD